MRRTKVLVFLTVSILATLSCQKNQPIAHKKQVNGETLINLISWVATMSTTVYLSDFSGTPIQNALVILNVDTLQETEPGTYRHDYAEVFPIPDTFNLSVNDEDDTFSIKVLPPNPPMVEIVSPANSDTLPSGEPLPLIWRSCDHASYYEVQVVDIVGSLKYQALTEDTTILVPDSAFSGLTSARIKVWAVAGPSLKNGTPMPNINKNHWVGTYAIKALGETWIRIYIRENPHGI